MTYRVCLCNLSDVRPSALPSFFFVNLSECLPFSLWFRGLFKIFLPLIRLLKQSLVSRIFFVLQRNFFPFIFVCLMVSVSDIPKHHFLFLYVLIISRFDSSFPSIASHFPFLLSAWLIFQCQIPFLYPFIICIRVSSSFSCPVGWGCRIHRLLLCRRIRFP